MWKNHISLYNLVNSLGIGLLLLDNKLNIEFFNKELSKILGFDDETSVNKKILDKSSNFKIKDFLISDKKQETDKVKYNGKDLILVKKKIIENDIIKGIYLIFQYLDTYKEFVRQFDDETEASFLLKTVMEATNDAIVYVNKDGYVKMLSAAYAEFLKVNREEAIGKHVREVIENTRMDIVIKTGKPEIAQVQEINGRKMIATRIPVVANGKIIGAVGKVLFKDVDELNSLYMEINKIEKELNLYKDEFKRVNKAKYALDSIISESKVMEELKEITKRAAKTNSNVLVLGELELGRNYLPMQFTIIVGV